MSDWQVIQKLKKNNCFKLRCIDGQEHFVHSVGIETNGTSLIIKTVDDDLVFMMRVDQLDYILDQNCDTHP